MNSDTNVRERRACSPLPPRELERYKDLLVARRGDLVQSCQGLSNSALRKAGERGGGDSAVSDDAADLAAEVVEQNLSIEMLERIQAELEEIESALERIEDRTYGSCEECGRSIPQARLEAIPTADTCVPCKTASEAA